MDKSLVFFAYCINKILFFNSSRRNRSIGITTVVIIGIIIVLTGIFFLGGNPAADRPIDTPAPNPVEFDYVLDLTSENGTILQGNSVNIKLSISYLQGYSENITLAASGIPSNADYAFSQSRGFPTNDSTFNSILTIYVSEAVPANSYSIIVSSTSDNGKSYSFPYTLFVLDSRILVSGRVNGGVDVIPSEIIFEVIENSGDHTYRFVTLVEEGNYEISLLNTEFYAVAVCWEKLDGSSGTYYFIQPFRVNAGVGVTSINCPFSFGLLPTTD